MSRAKTGQGGRGDADQPVGSEFRFRSDETGLTPDAVTYLSAGIGFCFMTQFGRYARIMKKVLDQYRIVQDTHFYPGEAGRPGRMDPVETHVYPVTPEDVDFARQTLDRGEQTCFLPSQSFLICLLFNRNR